MKKLKENSLQRPLLIFLASLVFLPVFSSYKRDEVRALVTGSWYYVDVNNGNNSNSGSIDSPWQTLEYVINQIEPGDGILLNEGNYGSFSYNESSNKCIVIMNREDKLVTFTNVYLSSPELFSSNMVLYGLQITPEWVDPASSGKPGCDDPHYAESRGDTYAKTAVPVYLKGVSNFKLINCKIFGTNKFLTMYGVWISNSDSITVEHCEFTKVSRSISIKASTNVNVLNNYAHAISGTFVQIGDDVSGNILIEGNHAVNSNFDYSEPYCIRAAGQSIHASAVSIRCSHVTIRNNIFHHGFNSSGIMTYDDSPVMSHIVIENNLLYDLPYFVLRFGNVGEDVLVRNNTIIGSHKPERNYAALNYETVIQQSSFVEGYASPRIFFYNNVLVGAFNVDTANVVEKKNICWSYYEVVERWQSQSDLTAFGSNSKVLSWDNTWPDTNYFTDGFFVEDPDFTHMHGLTIDYRLAEGSEAINFGDPALQTARGLGSIGPDGFIRNDGIVRDNEHHSAGCYEFLNASSLKPKTSDQLLIYPIPCKGSLNIVSDGVEWTSVDIYTLSGKKVYQIKDLNGSTEVDLSGLRPGVYFVRAKSLKSYYVKRIVRL